MLARTSTVQGWALYLFVCFEGVTLNILLQLWVLFDTVSFLNSYAPAFAETTHDSPLLIQITRCWAYMIVVFGLIEISVLLYGDFASVTCFQMAAAVGDILHVIVYSTFFVSHGEWDAGSIFAYTVCVALFCMRWVWIYQNRLSLSERTTKRGTHKAR